MNSLLLLSCVVAVALCLPADYDLVRQLPAVRHEEVHDEHGQYALRYVTAEGTVVSERGYLIPGANGSLVLAIEGKTQYVSDNGEIISRSYYGGPGGFQVEGNDLPKNVPLPAI